MKTASQTNSILARLSRSANKWVALPALYEASGALAVATRISNLRKRGHDIRNKTLRLKDGTTASFYKLCR